MASLVLAGCTGGNGSGTHADGEPTIDTVRGTWLTDPTTFDPALVTARDDYRAAALSFDTVLHRDDSGLVGGIAESYESTASNVTLQIRDGLTCADGTAITAKVVADSLARLADPETGSTIAPLIFGTANYGDGVEVTSDDAAGSVSIELTGAPYSELAVGLTVPAAGIVCPAGLEDPEGLAAGTVEGAFSGAYTPGKKTSGVGYEYELREDYDSWPEYEKPLEGVPAKTLKFSVGAMEAAPNQLMTGDLEWAQVGVEDLARFETAPWTINPVNLGDYFIIFNQSETSPFADRDLRVAAAQAIDVDGFKEAVNPNAERDLSAGGASVECVNEDASILVQHDAKAAAKVLDGVKIRLIGSNTAIGPNGIGNTFVQEQLRAAGAEVELANVDNGTWITTILGPETNSWDMTVFSSINNVGTLVTGLSRGFGTSVDEGGRNISRSDNPAAVEAFSEAMAADNDEDKCAAYQRVQKAVLHDEVSLVPLVNSPSMIVTGDKVAFRTPGGGEDFTNLRIIG